MTEPLGKGGPGQTGQPMIFSAQPSDPDMGNINLTIGWDVFFHDQPIWSHQDQDLTTISFLPEWVGSDYTVQAGFKDNEQYGAISDVLAFSVIDQTAPTLSFQDPTYPTYHGTITDMGSAQFYAGMTLFSLMHGGGGWQFANAGGPQNARELWSTYTDPDPAVNPLYGGTGLITRTMQDIIPPDTSKDSTIPMPALLWQPARLH